MAASAKTVAADAIDSRKTKLELASEEIWRNPELAFEEHKAHQILTDFLEKEGFAVERGYCGISTAFRATFGSGKPNVCVICEYDALPKIGHACGHNLIAEAGLAAGLGVKAFLEGSGCQGTLTVMGTPAEEGGGGKVHLIEKEVFKGIDMAMMVHPAPFDCIIPQVLATDRLNIEFTGRAAHAASFPWEGVNALDAAVMTYNSISVLRQQMKPSWRVHGVITNGGVKPKIIPEKAAMIYQYRAPDSRGMNQLQSKIKACVEASGHCTGCSVTSTSLGKPYKSLISNRVLTRLYGRNLNEVDITDCVVEGPVLGSTDMGNVSHEVPSLHPCYRVGSGEVLHTREFTAVANATESHSKTLQVAKSMAFMCIDVLTGGEQLLTEITTSFNEDSSNQ